MKQNSYKSERSYFRNTTQLLQNSRGLSATETAVLCAGCVVLAAGVGVIGNSMTALIAANETDVACLFDLNNPCPVKTRGGNSAGLAMYVAGGHQPETGGFRKVAERTTQPHEGPVIRTPEKPFPDPPPTTPEATDARSRNLLAQIKAVDERLAVVEEQLARTLGIDRTSEDAEEQIRKAIFAHKLGLTRLTDEQLRLLQEINELTAGGERLGRELYELLVRPTAPDN